MGALDSNTFLLLDKEPLGFGHSHNVHLLILEIIPSHIILRDSLPCVALFGVKDPFNTVDISQISFKTRDMTTWLRDQAIIRHTFTSSGDNPEKCK
jgi:hypothetical protein